MSRLAPATIDPPPEPEMKLAPAAARRAAEELAAELAALPQGCMRSDRLSALHQWGHSEAEAMDFEFGSLSAVCKRLGAAR